MTGALSSLRVIDLTDERAIVGAKMIADLGGDVVRPELPNGDPLRKRGPFCQESQESLWFKFFASSRRFFQIDPETEEDCNQLQQLCESAHAVLVTDKSPLGRSVDLDKALERNPGLVIVECSSFGRDGPWANFEAPDIVAGALGGAVATTGDVDTPPLKTFGDLNFFVSGAYVALAALAALTHARKTGEGQVVHVPVHECIASCLEHVFMWYEYHEFFANARARALERRGSLHWTDLYVVMQAIGGSIMVTPTPSIDTQLAWMIEEDAFDDLLDPSYQERENRGKYVRRMMALLHEWVGTREVESLFMDAQERHCPYGWVLSLDQVAENPQLAAREWWSSYSIGDRDVRGPGSPYQFNGTPAQARNSSYVRTEEKAVLDQIGWDGK